MATEPTITEAEIDAAKSYLDKVATLAGRDSVPTVIVTGMLEAAARVRATLRQELRANQTGDD